MLDDTPFTNHNSPFTALLRVLNIIGFDPFYTRMFRKGDARLRSLALRASPLRGLFINTLLYRRLT